VPELWRRLGDLRCAAGFDVGTVVVRGCFDAEWVVTVVVRGRFDAEWVVNGVAASVSACGRATTC
jgi:hypothetical protein